ncbi:hypothetical protein JXR93_14170 [bacterium]|nr:hypothetical protein [bacterium]
MIKPLIITIFLILSFQISAESISISGMIREHDIKTLKKIEDKEIFIFLDSIGSKIDTIFNLLDELNRKKQNGVKIYSIIEENSSCLSGCFFIPLLSDVVFYKNPITLGAFTPLSQQTYKKYKERFQRIFSFLEKNNGISAKRYTNFFLNGELFSPTEIGSISNKYIKFENFEDIFYHFDDKKEINREDNIPFIERVIISPNMAFILSNIFFILLIYTVFVAQNWFFSITTSVILIFDSYYFFIFPINFNSLFAIFLTHLILVYKHYSKLSLFLTFFSFTLYILSSINFINPLDSNYYLDMGYRVSIILIIGIYLSIFIIYKILFYIFLKRFTLFNKKQNDFIFKEGVIVLQNEVSLLLFNGELFKYQSKNRLVDGDKVIITSFKKLTPVVERVD